MHQVKGLEFAGVILRNPTQKAYPPTELGRNLLYVAITRAGNRLAVYHREPLTGIMSPSVQGDVFGCGNAKGVLVSW